MRALLSFVIAVYVLLTPPRAALGADLPQLPTTVRITRQPDAATLLPSGREFEVECKISSKKISFSIPCVTVRDGEKVTLADTTTTPRVVAHKLEKGQLVPISRQLVEGTTAEVTVIAIDEKQVVLEFSLLLQGQGRGSTKRHVCRGATIVENVALGEKVECELEADAHFEVTVNERRSQAGADQ